MAGLVVWTAADASLVTKTIGTSLKKFKPHVPEHRFVSFDPEKDPPVPAKGEVILACGKRCVDALQRKTIIPKNRTLTSMRERAIPCNGGTYIVTYDPGTVNSEPENKTLLDWDLRLAVRLLRTDSLMPPIGNYKWVTSYEEMVNEIEAKHAKTQAPVDVSMDTETMGLYPWYKSCDIISISFTHEVGESRLLYFGDQPCAVQPDGAAGIWHQLQWLLNSPKVKLRMANGKFDLIWIAEKWGIECTNFKFDTMLVGSLLNENRSNSLNLHAKVYTDLGGYDDPFNVKYDKGHMEVVPTDDLLVYAGGDTDACQRTADTLRDELLEDPELAQFYITVLHPAARAFEKIERRGVCIDIDKYAQLGDDLHKSITADRKKALELLPFKLRMKLRDSIERQQEKDKNPFTGSLITEYFFTQSGLNLKPKMVTEKTGRPSTAKTHLKMFADHPAAKAMLDVLTSIGSAEKTLQTYCTGFLKHLRPDDRFHPSYMLFHGGFNDNEDDDSGTVSGRLSAKDPAFQTIPKKTTWAKRLRECYIAPLGKSIVMLDYSQGELRIVACIANEKTMIKAYEANLDLHAVTGAKLAEVPFDDFMMWKTAEDKALQTAFKKARDNAKPANFGLLYGMGAEGFQRYAFAQYGLKFTLEEAEKVRADFFALYAGLGDYHEAMKKAVRRYEMVRSPLGRIRHLPTIRAWDRQVAAYAERQAINSPVQSTLSDMMLWSIAEIEDAFPNGEVEMVGMIHDAFMAYIDTDHVQERAQACADIMIGLDLKSLGWEPQLKFPSEGESGLILSQLEPLKLAA